MYVEFDSLPGSSKVWIYQSSKAMTNDQAIAIFENAKYFIQSWTAHQAELNASVALFHNFFIVFAVDESYNESSGCSVDKLNHFLKVIEQKTGLDFFDRLKIAYLDDQSVKLESMHTLPEMITSGKLNKDTIIFDNLITNLEQFRKNWKTPIKNSWVSNVI